MAPIAAPSPTKKPSQKQDETTAAAPAPVRKSTRITWKVQPGIKDRAESFLASAAADLGPIPTVSRPTVAGTIKSRKRKLHDLVENEKATARSIKPKPQTVHEEEEEDAVDAKPKNNKKDEEKRLRSFRKQAPKTFLEKLSRAQIQRMIVIGRTRSDTESFPREEIDIVGSTGNIYRVTIGQTPSCTCPDSKKGNECKHKVYVLHTVLKAPEHFQYQMAFLSSELREIFARAPPIPTDVSSSHDVDGNRKLVEGECPICYMDFDEENNELVWCKAACGNNMHKSCFDQWAASQRGSTVKCVYCRAPWQVDHGDLQSFTQGRSVDKEGYVNVAEQFGMSRARDTSTYNQYWVRRTFGMGY